MKIHALSVRRTRGFPSYIEPSRFPKVLAIQILNPLDLPRKTNRSKVSTIMKSSSTQSTGKLSKSCEFLIQN